MTMDERCEAKYPVRLGNDRYEWRRCLLAAGHDVACVVAPEPHDSGREDDR